LNGVIGYTRTLGVIDINGNLDLNAAITNATSMDVSGTANLGADVTTSGNQTYTGDITLSADVGLNTSGGDVQIDGDVNTSYGLFSSTTSILTYGYNGDVGYTSSSSYAVTIASNQTVTRVQMFGGSGGNGGCDGQCGSDTGQPGYLDATVSISNTILNIAPGGGGGTGASNVNWSRVGGAAGVNALNSSFNGGEGGRAG
jgi:hypothetical protein